MKIKLIRFATEAFPTRLKFDLVLEAAAAVATRATATATRTARLLSYLYIESV